MFRTSNCGYVLVYLLIGNSYKCLILSDFELEFTFLDLAYFPP